MYCMYDDMYIWERASMCAQTCDICRVKVVLNPAAVNAELNRSSVSSEAGRA